MAIYLGGEQAVGRPNLDDLTLRQIVEELDKYDVGQNPAKKLLLLHFEIADEALRIAGKLCIYTNSDLIVEEI